MAASFSSFLRCAFAACAAAAFAEDDCLCGTRPNSSTANRRAASSEGAPAFCREVYNASGEEDFRAK